MNEPSHDVWKPVFPPWYTQREGREEEPYFLMQLSCSVTGGITQSAELKTLNIPALLGRRRRQPSQIWSADALLLCHRYLRWWWYYEQVNKAMEAAPGRKRRDAQGDGERWRWKPPRRRRHLKEQRHIGSLNHMTPLMSLTRGRRDQKFDFIRWCLVLSWDRRDSWTQYNHFYDFKCYFVFQARIYLCFGTIMLERKSANSPVVCSGNRHLVQVVKTGIGASTRHCSWWFQEPVLNQIISFSLMWAKQADVQLLNGFTPTLKKTFLNSLNLIFLPKRSQLKQSRGRIKNYQIFDRS